MSYLIILKKSHTLPFVLPVNEKSIASALSELKKGFAETPDQLVSFHFLIDQETNAIYRIYKDSNGELQVSPEEDSMKELGELTNHHYFEGTQQIDKPETAEMSE
jgi:hypothetical protein